MECCAGIMAVPPTDANLNQISLEYTYEDLALLRLVVCFSLKPWGNEDITGVSVVARQRYDWWW